MLAILWIVLTLYYQKTQPKPFGGLSRRDFWKMLHPVTTQLQFFLVAVAGWMNRNQPAVIAGIYFIGADGTPWRIGMAAGNEFSDHEFERKNYLNRAGSKLRNCSLGPELVVDPDFQSVPGLVKIERAGAILWSREIATGENEMCHSLANIEHHHFKFEGHRHPGDLHIHYFGACGLSFGAGVELADGDVMDISFTGFGRPLRNPVRV